MGFGGGDEADLPERVAGATGSIQLSMTTDDVDAAVAVLAAHGAPIVGPPAHQPWGERMAYVADPDGYRIMLYAKIEP